MKRRGEIVNQCKRINLGLIDTPVVVDRNTAAQAGRAAERAVRQALGIPEPWTDDELRAAVEKARQHPPGHAGSMHTLWEAICEAEAILAGRRSILSRDQVETLLAQYRR